MNSNYTVKGAPGSFSRRRFISSCAVCGACLAVAPLSFSANLEVPGEKQKKLKIRILYSLSGPVHTAPRAWPNIGFDFTPWMDQINKALTKHFRDFEFLPEMAAGPEDAEKIVAKDNTDPADGFIVYQMELWNKVVQTIAQTGKPVLYADFSYGGSGGFQRYIAAFIRGNTPNVGFISSTSMDDLLTAVNCFKIIRKGGTAADFVKATTLARLKATPPLGKFSLAVNPVQSLTPEECIYRLKNSKMLAVRDQKAGTGEPVMNIPLEYITFSEVDEAWSVANKDEAAEVADRWSKEASEIVDVSERLKGHSIALTVVGEIDLTDSAILDTALEFVINKDLKFDLKELKENIVAYFKDDDYVTLEYIKEYFEEYINWDNFDKCFENEDDYYNYIEDSSNISILNLNELIYEHFLY